MNRRISRAEWLNVLLRAPVIALSIGAGIAYMLDAVGVSGLLGVCAVSWVAGWVAAHNLFHTSISAYVNSEGRNDE